LIFDVLRQPASTAIWRPFERWLGARGVDLRLGTPVEAVERRGSHWEVGDTRADLLVLATTVPGLQELVAASPALAGSSLAGSVAALEVTRPFAVWRLWLDRPLGEGRPPFVGTT